MLSETSGLLDPGALAIVVGGTALATCARMGWRDVHAALQAAARLGRSGFDEDGNRALLARNIREIRERGHLAARLAFPPDPATVDLLDSYLTSGSIETLHRMAQQGRAAREAKSARAASVFENAGEVAPVFGLVGTLIAITQLMPDIGSGAAESVMTAIAGAVVSTLYGVLLAQLVCFPLGRAILRQRQSEEAVRGGLVDWFENELSETRSPGRSPVPPKITPKLRDVA